MFLGLPCGLAGKESACNVGDLGSIPGLGRFPGEVKGYPLQYSCLGNPKDRGAWQVIAHGIAKDSNQTTRIHSAGGKGLMMQGDPQIERKMHFPETARPGS